MSDTPKTVLNVHPKVFVSFLTGLGLAILAGVAEKLQPGLFTQLGIWATPAYVGATALVSAALGWLKKVKTSESESDDMLPTPIPAPDEPAASTLPTNAPDTGSDALIPNVPVTEVPVSPSGTSSTVIG